MKKLLYILLIFFPLLVKSQTPPGALFSVTDASVLETTIPSGMAFAIVGKKYTANENPVYIWVTGGLPVAGAQTDNLKSLKYIIVPDGQTNGFWSTITQYQYTANIPDFYTAILAYLNSNNYVTTSSSVLLGKMDSVRTKYLLGLKANQSDLNTTNSNVTANTTALGTKYTGAANQAGAKVSVANYNVTLSALNSADISTALGYTPLQSYTETDPTVPAYAKSLTAFSVIKTSTDPLYASLTGSYANPVWITSLAYSKLTGTPTLTTVATTGSYSDLINKPTIYSFTGTTGQYTLGNGSYTAIPVYSTVATTGSYTDLLSKPTIYAFTGTTAQYTKGDGTYATLNTANVPELTNLYYTDARARLAYSALANGGITYNNATGEISQTTPTYNNAPARVLTTSFRPSTVRPTRVSYSIDITTALSLANLTGSGTVVLQISSDNSTWTTINKAGLSRTLSVAITLGLNETTSLNLQGEIPANYYCRLLPATTGTGTTITVTNGQEVVY